MAYLGRQPVIGNFVKLDAISVVNGQASYTMQNGGVNFTSYDNVNQFLVSLNGILQSPTDSFTVSGSTLTFASNLSTGDVIDFVMVLGNTLDVGTPSDNTVTTAKISDSAITPAKLGYDYNQYRNIIINGDMSIAQRGTSVSTLASSGYYTLDRFKFQAISAGVWTMSQDTDVPTGQGFAKSLKMDCTSTDAVSGNDLLIIRQYIEGQNLQYLKKGTANAQSLTASFWVKSNKTGTYILELFDVDNTRQISKSYTIDSADTWEKKTISIPADTTGAFGNDNGGSLIVSFWLAAGSDYTSGTLSTTWTSPTTANRAVGQVNLADSTANEWYITGVQLEAGTSASDFEFLPYDVNIDRCYRYYQKSFEYGTSVGTSTQVGFRSTSGHQGGTSTDYIEGDLTFDKIMRASPTLTLYDHSGNSGKCARLATGVARYANENISTSNLSPRGVHIYSTSGTAAGIIQVHFVAEAEL